jgi:hypothetical protein
MLLQEKIKRSKIKWQISIKLAKSHFLDIIMVIIWIQHWWLIYCNFIYDTYACCKLNR